MKRILVLVAFMPALLGASQLLVESSISRTYEFSSGSLQKIEMGGGIELYVKELVDASTLSSTFNLAVVRMNENGALETLCENQLVVPFDTKVSLLFPKYAMKLTFVASSLEKPLPTPVPATN